MKKSITYREITVAIGVLVAMLVAMTLWIGAPETPASSLPQGRVDPAFTSALEAFRNPRILFGL